MSKKQFLELLIKTFGLTPVDVKHYRTDGCDGQYEVATGWMGIGIDEKGVRMIEFCEPDGFNMAVNEILTQAQNHKCRIVYVSD